jgi:exosortase
MKTNEVNDSTDGGLEDGRPLSPMLLGILALAGFGPLLAQFLFNLWKFDTYQFFPLALAGAGFLAWRGLREVPRPLEHGSAWLTVPGMAVVFAVLAAASVLWSPWMGAVSFLLALAVFAWWLGGWSLVKALFPAWIMLLTVVPPPLKLDTRFALLLQEWATAGSSAILALLGVPHFLSGMLIEIPGQRLLVEEACSGINSVLFMTSACVFYAMWRRRSLPFLAVLYLLTIGCVLLGNLVRITSGAWVLHNMGIDLFVGWKHETLGLVLTATYLGFIVLADWILDRIMNPFARRRRGTAPVEHESSVLDGTWFEGGLKFTAVILVLFGATQLVRGWDFHFHKSETRVVNPDWMDGSPKFVMPRQLDGWRLLGESKPVPAFAAYEDGVYSHIWQYEKGGMVATVSLDYPFFDYHDVTVCYRGAGWEIGDMELQRAAPENANIPARLVSMTKEGGIKADLFHSTVSEGGVWLEEPGSFSPLGADGASLQEGDLFERLTHRIRTITQAGDAYQDSINYRIQLLAAARGGLGENQRREVQQLFQQARLDLAAQFIETPAPTPTPTPKPVYEPLPDSVPDPTRLAIEKAADAAEALGDSAIDATRQALEDARREAEALEAAEAAKAAGEQDQP